jgi:glutamine---fructose-6-phosphate transaminase (isomerizing)
MCGIVGYLGKKHPLNVLLDSLALLEYRGYDSSGVAYLNPSESSEIQLVKAKGKLMNLKAKLNGHMAQAYAAQEDQVRVGIGHIRWATHGAPTDVNAHPHASASGDVVVVHNGIFENFSQLRSLLQGEGIQFLSETDTECAPHLISRNAQHHPESFLQAFQKTLGQIQGAYALCFIRKEAPETLYVARHQAPLVLGVGEGEFFVASDTVALAKYTNQFIFLEDGEYAEISLDKGIQVFNAQGLSVTPTVKTLKMDGFTIDKGGYKHFMLKEIYEQPDVVRNALMGRLEEANAPVALMEADRFQSLFQNLDRLIILGCGTSYNAGLTGKYFIEEICRIPVEVEAAGEFRYRHPILSERTLVVAISQSGETADTLEALKQCKRLGAKTLAITNREESSIAREVDVVLPVRAGVEVSVCATKSFLAQLMVLYLVGLAYAEQFKTADPVLLLTLKQELLKMPFLIEQTLATLPTPLQALAKQYGSHRDMIFMARGILFPVALEGALKLKEISYIHAEGYSGAELKHGPIALLDASVPVVSALAAGPLAEKTISNCQEAKARDARLIGFSNLPEAEMPQGLFEAYLQVPACNERLAPLLLTIPLQLFSYYIAEYLGKDVDQPRNLAKSVTVE